MATTKKVLVPGTGVYNGSTFIPAKYTDVPVASTGPTAAQKAAAAKAAADKKAAADAAKKAAAVAAAAKKQQQDDAAAAAAGLAEAGSIITDDQGLITDLGAEDSSGNITLPGVNETDALIQEGNKYALAAGGSKEIFGDAAGFSQAAADAAVAAAGTGNPLTDLAAQEAAAARVDAFKLLESIFTSYGLSELVPSIRELMQGVKDPVTGKIMQVGPNEAALLLKTDKRYNAPYLARFAGNEARRAAGLNVYTEGDYLAHEDEYSALFEQYGQKSLGTRAEFANLIGSDISKAELNSRLDLAVMQVQNADPQIKQTLQQFYPGISDSDLVTYFLKPEETLPRLQQKVTSAQIGTAAIEQGLSTSVAAAEDLAKYGISQSAAQTGYAKIGEVLPVATKLSNIYNEAQVGYDQATAEQEVFKGSASAQRKRLQLKQLEEAQFSGRSGINQQINPLGKGLQGSF